jgi:hypothetical protein
MQVFLYVVYPPPLTINLPKLSWSIPFWIQNSVDVYWVPLRKQCFHSENDSLPGYWTVQTYTEYRSINSVFIVEVIPYLDTKQCRCLKYLHHSPARRKRQSKANPVPRGLSVSDETVKYGYGFCVTRTIEWLQCKLLTHLLIRESTPQKKDCNFQTATFWQEVTSGHKFQRGLDTKTYSFIHS